MIIYATKKTMERYKLKTPQQLRPEAALHVQAIMEKEHDNRLYEWGCKLFYFDGRKSLLVMHYETKLVIYLLDIKIKELEFAINAIPQFLMDMYSSDPVMQQALEKYFAAAHFVCFDQIKDRSIIASMNTVHRFWAMEGDRFYDYIHDGILHTRKINRDVNDIPATRKVDGKEEWYIPYKLFAEKIKMYFSDK